jgi:hypothetical protein
MINDGRDIVGKFGNMYLYFSRSDHLQIRIRDWFSTQGSECPELPVESREPDRIAHGHRRII